MSTAQHIADLVEQGLYAIGLDPLVEEDARTEPSHFRVEVEDVDGIPWVIEVIPAVEWEARP